MMLYAVFLCLLFLCVGSPEIIIVDPGPTYVATKGSVWPAPMKVANFVDYYTVDLAEIEIRIVGKSCPVLKRAVDRYEKIINDMSSLLRQDHNELPAEASYDDVFGSNVKSLKSKEGNPRRTALPDNPFIFDEYNETLELAQRNDFSRHVRRARHVGKKEKALGRLQALVVNLTMPCNPNPYLHMIESYNLAIWNISYLNSKSVWGILRGLETFSQMLYYTDDFKEIRINASTISDAPRYAHRGLLLDTSRHYISLENIYRTLDAMAYNKLNVFHWHIVDDQSFPYVSDKFPDLSKLGAYDQSAVYTRKDVNRVVRYARDRGIRVIPEFDVPGHTRSWGQAMPTLLTKCYEGGKFAGLGPMNPLYQSVYSFLGEFFAEVHQAFPDTYLHVGGDEVDYSCWLSNPEIQKFMADYNLTDPEVLHDVFMSNVIPRLPAKVTPIVWEEVVQSDVNLPKNSIVQVWKESSPIDEFLTKGYRVVYSACWYLDHLSTGGDWTEFYACDPRDLVDPDYRTKIVGGEACMWGEVVDDTNVLSRVWPRASAVAERLWSPSDNQQRLQGLRAKVQYPAHRVYRRIEEHTCRMRRRGINAQPPNAAGYCHL